MALGNGGLDAQVEQRMDAYRGNPQKLQQRYGQNKELLDLLALQKLTSEKKQVAADMQLKAQNNPNTIAQQREAEALELTKSAMGGTLGELAGRTKGTLDQKAAMQKKNINRMVQGAGKAPTGIAGLPGLAGKPRPNMPPQAQGLAGARMAQAAQQPGGPVRMAQGGIVAFKEGEGVVGKIGEHTPFSRRTKKFLGNLTENSEQVRLRNQVQSKFGLFASPFGALRRQTDKQRTYAKDVISNIDNFSVDELKELVAAPFEAGMTDTAVDALPVLDGTSNEKSLEQGPKLRPAGLGNNQDKMTGNVTFMPTEQEDFFKDVPTSYEPVKPQNADKSALDASVLAMDEQASNVPTMETVSNLEAAPLESVKAPYTDSEQQIADMLQSQYTADAGIDVGGELKDARASSDAYYDREGKAKVFADQEVAERALQSETLDPARLKKLARMQTLAGGRRGAGGIGQAYVDSQLGQDERRSAGLNTLRGIQDLGVSTDVGIANYGSTAGENAASRATTRRVGGMGGLQSMLDASQERALQGQDVQNQVNVMNKKYEISVAEGNFDAAREALDRQGSMLRKVVEMNLDDVNNQVKRNVSISEDQNKALSEAVEAKLEKAKAKSEERLKTNEKLFNSEVELQKLADKRAETITTLVADAMNNDIQAMQLKSKLQKLSQSENRVDYERIEGQLKKIEMATIRTLSNMYTGFADAYADMVTLNQRIQQIRAGNTALQSTPRRLDAENVTMEQVSYAPSVPNP